MDALFINSKNSKISDPHRLLLNLSDKTNMMKSNEYIALSNLSIYYTWKKCKNNRLKIIFNME